MNLSKKKKDFIRTKYAEGLNIYEIEIPLVMAFNISIEEARELLVSYYRRF
jgi:hypothetical protein